MHDLALLREWAPQAYGVWTLVLIAVLYFIREWRETRKLSSTDRLARREGYALQVENLQRENRFLQTDLTNLRHEYDDYRRLCQQETDDLRNQVIQLENNVAGLRRRVDTQAATLPRLIEDTRKDGK